MTVNTSNVCFVRRMSEAVSIASKFIICHTIENISWDQSDSRGGKALVLNTANLSSIPRISYGP